MDLSWRVPVLLYAFRPSRSESPPASWVKLAKENENNLEILIGTMECSQSEQADEYVRNEPLVMRIYEAKIKSVQMVEIKDKLPGLYHRIIDELLMEKHGQLISITNRVPDHFPTIVFDVNRNDSIGKRTALNAALAMSHHDIVHFHYNITSNPGRRARAYLASDCVVEFEGNWLQPDLTAFVVEYGRKLVSENRDDLWEWQRKGGRRAVMIVSNNEMYCAFFNILAREFRSDFCFVVLRGGAITMLKVNIQTFTWPEPLVVVSNGRDEFVALPEATDFKKIRALLQEVKNDAKHVEWQTAADVDFERKILNASERIWLFVYFSYGMVIALSAYSIYTCYRCCQLTKEDGYRKLD